MFRLTSVAVLLVALAAIPAVQAEGPVQMLFASNVPNMDGQITPDEWVTPGFEQVSTASGANVKSGSFTGADDLTIHAWYIFSASQIYIGIRVEDDVVGSDDTLHVDLGLLTLTIRAGEDTEGPSGDWQVVKRGNDPWEMEIRILGSLAGPATAYSLNLRFEDDDGGADGEFWRNDVGVGVLEPVNPRADLQSAATLLDALDASFDDIGNLSKRASRIRKAADAALWSDDFTHVSKSAASDSLNRVRKAIKKLEKFQRKADAVRASQLDTPLEILIRATRAAAWRLLALAEQTQPLSPTAAIERLEQAEDAYDAGDFTDASKYYRKAAKKAAKLVF